MESVLLYESFRDMNQDGRPDLYVCNDFESPDRIWINQGKGVFRLIDIGHIRKSSHFSMGDEDINLAMISLWRTCSAAITHFAPYCWPRLCSLGTMTIDPNATTTI